MLKNHIAIATSLNWQLVIEVNSPGGGGIFFPFFGPLVVSFRLGYLKAVSTSCWQTVSTSEVFNSYVFSS